MNILKACLIFLLLCFHHTFSKTDNDTTRVKDVNVQTEKDSRIQVYKKPAGKIPKVKLLISLASEASSIQEVQDSWFSSITEAYFNFQLRNFEDFEIISRKELSDKLKQGDDYGVSVPESELYQLAKKAGASHVLIHLYSINRKDSLKINYYLDIIDMKNKKSVMNFDQSFLPKDLDKSLKSCTNQILNIFQIKISERNKENLKQQVLSSYPAINKIFGETLIEIIKQDSLKTAQKMTKIVQNDPGFGLAVFKTAELFEALKKHAMASSLYNQLFLRNGFYYNRLFLKSTSYNRKYKLYNQALQTISLAEKKGFNSLKLLQEKAVVLLKMQKFPEALKCFEEILKNDPDQPEAILNIAKIKRKKGLYREALDLLDNINPALPNIAIVNLEKAANYYALKQYKEALDILQSMYRHKPADPKLNTLMGDINYRLKIYKTAASHYQTAVHKKPNNLNLLLKTSNALQMAGDFQNALNILKKYKPNIDDSKQLDKEIGLLLFHSKDTAEALSLLKSCVDIKPPDSSVFIVLGDIYSSSGNLDEAIDMYEKAESLVKNKVRIKLSLANLYLTTKKYGHAETKLRNIISVNPKLPGVNRSLANILYINRKITDALGYYKKERELHGDNTYVQQRIALINYKLNDYENALKETEKLLELDSSNTTAYLQLAVIAIKQFRNTDAKLYYKKADAAGKLTKDNYLMLGNGFKLIQLFDEAIDAYNKSLKFDPSNEKALMELGKIYAKMNKDSLAAKTYTKIYKTDPGKRIRYLEKAGHIYFKLGNISSAEKVYNTLLKKGYTNDRILVNTAAIEFQSKKYEKVISLLKKVKDTKAIDTDVKKMYAVSYYETKKYSEAQIYFNHFLKNESIEKDFVEKAIGCYENTNNLPSATIMYKRYLSLKKDKNHKDFTYRLAVIYEKQKSIPIAIEQYQKNIKLFPDDIRNYEKLYVLLIKGKKINEAQSLLLKVTNQPDCPNIYFKKLAKIYSLQKKSKEAAYAYEQYLKNAPKDSLAWYECGSSYYSLKLYNEAIYAFEKTLQLMPTHLPSMNKLTDSYFKTGDLNNAINSLHIILALNPSNENALLELANIYTRKKDSKKTAEIYEKVFKSNPEKNSEYLAKAGHIYFKIPVKDMAYAIYNKFIAQGFTDPVVSINLAKMEFEKNRHQKTISLLKDLSGKYASDSGVVNMLIQSYSQIGTKNVTITDINKLLSKAPDNRNIIEMAAIAYDKKGDIQSAAKMYKKFLKFPKTDSHQNYGYRLAEIYEKQNSIPSAIEQYRKNIQLFPDDLRNFEKLIPLLISSKNYKTAQLVLLKVTKQKNCPNIYFKKLAQVYVFQKLRKEAAEAYEKYLKNAPKDSLSWYECGSIYYSLNNYKKAIYALEKTVQLMPSQSAAMDKLTDSYFKTGDLTNAINSLHITLALNPSNENVLHKLADIYTRKKDNLKSAEIYEKLFEVDREKNSKYLAKAGHIYYKIPNKEKAYTIYNKFILQGFNDPIVTINLAEMEFEKQQYQKTISLLKDLNGKLASDSRVGDMLVKSYKKIGIKDLKTSDINKLVSKKPNNKNIIKMAAIAYDEKGDIKSAAEMYKKFLTFPKTGSHQNYGYRLAEIYEKQNSIPSAIAQYRKNIQLFPDDLRNYEKLIPLLINSKKYGSAQPILLKATKQKDCPNIYFKKLAQVYAFQKLKKEAAEAYEKYLKNAPNDSLAWYECGSLYYTQKKYKKAIYALEKTIQLMPTHSAAMDKLTDSYFKTGDLTNAINSLHIILALNPSNENVLHKLADIYTQKKDNLKSAEIYEKLFEADREKNSKYLAKAGHIYYKIPSKEKAYTVYNKFILQGFKDPVISINLAEMEFEKQQYQKTISLLKDLNGKYASDSRVKDMLVQSYKKVGSKDLTTSDINKLVLKAPNNKSIIEMAAIAYEEKGDIKSAAKMYKRFLMFPKTDSHKNYGYRLAEIYEKLKSLPSAIEQYKKNIHLFPDDLRSYEKIIPLLLNEKRYKTALPILVKATKQKDCPNIYFKKLAEVYAFHKMKKEAAVTYEQYLKNAPNDSLSWYECGSLYYSLKIYKKAIHALEKTLQLMPAHSASIDKLTDSYIKTGDVNNAMNSLHIKLALNPLNENILLKLANGYKQKKDEQKLADIYEKLFDLNPIKNKKLLSRAGHIYFKIPIKDKAYAIYNKFILQGLDDPVVSINLAELEFEKNQYHKTISLLKDLSGKYASDPRVGDMLLQCYNKIGTKDLTSSDIETMLSKAPNNKKIIEMAAIAYEEKGDIEATIRMYKKFLRFPKTKSHQKYGYHLAELLEKHHMISGAIEQYKKNIQLFPEDLRNYEKLIPLLINSKKYNLAQFILLKAIKQKECPDVYFKKLAQVYDFQKMRREAAGAYEQYLKRVPNDFEAWNNLGSLYFLQQKYEKAITPLEKSKTHTTKDPSTYYKLGLSLFRTKQYKDAINPLLKTLKLRYNNTEVLELLSKCYSVEKDTINLIKVLKIRVAQSPKNVNLRSKYGELLFAAKQYEPAIRFFEMEHEKRPRNIKIMTKLIHLYEKTDNKARWIALIDSTLRYTPKNPDIHYKKALYYIESNNLTNAKTSLSKTLSLRPGHTLAHYNLAKLLEQEKKYKTAHYHYLQALKGEPKNIEYILKFAETSHLLGKRNQAIKSLNRVLKIDPDNTKALQLKSSI